MNLWVVVIRADDRYWLLAQRHEDQKNGRSSVVAFESKSKAVDHFEAAYNRNHDRGFEASMSACINGITYQPSVVGPINSKWKANDDAGVRRSFNELISVDGKMHLHQLSHVSGYVLAHLCDNQQAVGRLWEAGTKPRLIS